MHNNEFSRSFGRFLGFSSSFLSILFWVFLIFGFDEPRYAVTTIISALIHECGHLSYLLFKNRHRVIRGRPRGLLIGAVGFSSYTDMLLLYLCGPLANLFSALLFPIFSNSDYGLLFSTVNIATGLSNLLPIEGYDGYGIAKNVLCIFGREKAAYTVLPQISFAIICIGCFFALYLMDRFDGGYWIYAVLFTSMVISAGKTRRI